MEEKTSDEKIILVAGDGKKFEVIAFGTSANKLIMTLSRFQKLDLRQELGLLVLT